MASKDSSENLRTLWFYEGENPSQWIKFSDTENEILSEAKQSGKTFVQLDRCSVDLEKQIFIEENSSKSSKKIKFEIRSDQENVVRQQRFFVEPKLVKPLDDPKSNDLRFINDCIKQNRGISPDELLERAAIGIIEESSKIHQQIEGQWISKELQALKGKSTDEIDRKIIHLYSRESFLYRLINSTLRTNDHTKLNTLGPFCYLLFHCDCSKNLQKFGFNQRVYRGANLDQETIDSYEKSIGKIKTWDAFSSTSKLRKNAESFGNVLFIIDLSSRARFRFSGMDISSLSAYPFEQEVLIRAARNFIVEKLFFYPETKKYEIYLSLC